MPVVLHARRAVAGLLVILGLVLVTLAVLHGGPRILQARHAALDNAEQVISETVAPVMQQDHVSPEMTHVVQRLVAKSPLALTYLTLRNVNNVILVSRGRLGDVLRWLPDQEVSRWRGRWYRLFSAEASRVLRRDAQPIGHMRYGISWLAVLARMGWPLWGWLSIFIAGVALLSLGLVGSGAMAMATARQQRAKRAHLVGPSGPRRWGRRQRQEGFAPIPAHPMQRAGRSEAPPDVSLEATGVAARKSLMSDPDSVERETIPASPPAITDASVIAGSQLRPPPATADKFERPMGNVDAVAEQPEQPTPSIRLRPIFDDTTLDLRLFPVWRGVERRVLAGAWAMLAWRSGSGELVDTATLSRLAEQHGALRAFTRWLAQRLSMLHGNWRTLELASVPILLPVTEAMLSLADAEAVWRTALRRIDRDPGDLVIDVGNNTRLAAPLPVRCAIAGASDPDAPDDPLAAGDVLCVTPTQIDRDGAEILDRLQRPILFGPVSDPGPWASVITEDGLCWFSDTPSAENLHTPRTFARLLMRYRICPI